MTAIVPELVNMATDPSVSTSDLLRKALVVARRLEIKELADWINCELNGYSGQDIPEYRHVRSELKAMNPVRGPIPLYLPSAEMAEALTASHLRQSLPELVALSKSTTGLFSYFTAELEHSLMEMMQYPMRPVLSLSTTQLHGVIEIVRSRILEWALDLEGNGVLGEGMTFTPQEKQIVQQQHYHFGDVTGSQIQIGSDGASQTLTQTADAEALKALIAVLREVVTQGKVAGEAGEELRAELATLEAQAASPRPKLQVIKAAALSIKSVLENAAGGIISVQALPYLTPFLS